MGLAFFYAQSNHDIHILVNIETAPVSSFYSRKKKQASETDTCLLFLFNLCLDELTLMPYLT